MYFLAVSEIEREAHEAAVGSSRVEEIEVSDSDCRDLRILDRSDVVFAVIYGVLFLWGVVLTLLSIY